MYTNRVNTLNSDVARLHAKLADERTRWAGANSKVLRAVEALGKATSISQLASRGRDVERAQKALADADRKVADVTKTIGQKQKDLGSAQASLDRATREQQKKDDREADRRRKTDLEHIKKLERDRRDANHLPPGTPAIRRAVPQLQPAPSRQFDDTYDVCLSFAGEQRDYVGMVASELTKAGVAVFYDQDETIAAGIWGKDLGDYLDYIYRQGSRYCVMFISAEYADKAWTRHERRSALARSIKDENDYVLPARFDDTELPGLRSTTAYIDLRQTAPATLVEFVLAKLASEQAA